MGVKQLHKWWWAAYAALFPIMFIPIYISSNTMFDLRLWLTAIAIVGGFVLEILANPQSRLSDSSKLVGWLKQHPATIVVGLLAIWVIVSGFFTESPSVALMGGGTVNTNFFIGENSSVYYFLVCVVFILVYIRAIHDPQLIVRTIQLVILAACLLSILALFEVVMRFGFIYPSALQDYQLPLVTFLGRGHLAGFLCFVFGLSLLSQKRSIDDLFLLIIAFGIGLTQNRTSLIVVVLLTIVGFLYKRTKPKVMLSIAALCLAGLSTSQVLLWSNQSIIATAVDSSANSRVSLWQVGLKGILEKPVFGWGADQFDKKFTKFASQKQISSYLSNLNTEWKYLRHIDNIIVYKTKNTVAFLTVEDWKAHNVFIDFALQFGVIGLALLLILLLIMVLRKNSLFPPIFAILGYFLFLQFWLIPAEITGLLWVFLAFASINNPINSRTQVSSIS